MAKSKNTSPRRRQKRAADQAWLDDRYFLPYLTLPNTDAGLPVTPETSLRFSAVYACVRIIAETLASVPLIVYKRRADEGRERATTHPVYRLLKLEPNRRQRMTSFTFREYLLGHVLLRGNAYAQVLYKGNGQPDELVVLHPTRVRPAVEDDGEVLYLVRDRRGQEQRIPAYQMFHLQGYADNGLEGLSPIGLLREAVGLGLAAETFGANMIGNAAAPAGVLELAQGKLPADAKKRLKEDWERIYKGPRKAGQVAVLEAGLSWKSVGIPAKDAQYLELRRFQVEEIARIFRVPLFMLQDHTHSTFSNIEHLSINFVRDCIYPWARRFEEAVQRDLLGATDEVYAEFNLDGLLRGDVKARYDAYATGIQWGILTRNDVRRRENMDPLPAEVGDVVLTPLNMAEAERANAYIDAQVESLVAKAKADDAVVVQSDDEEEAEGSSADDERSSFLSGIRDGFTVAAEDVWGRIARKEVRAIASAARNRKDDFDLWFARFLGEQREFAGECLRPILTAYARSVEAITGQEQQAWVGQSLKHLLDDYCASLRQSVEQVRRAEDFAAGPTWTEASVREFWTPKTFAYHGGLDGVERRPAA